MSLGSGFTGRFQERSRLDHDRAEAYGARSHTTTRRNKNRDVFLHISEFAGIPALVSTVANLGLELAGKSHLPELAFLAADFAVAIPTVFYLAKALYWQNRIGRADDQVQAVISDWEHARPGELQ